MISRIIKTYPPLYRKALDHYYNELLPRADRCENRVIKHLVMGTEDSFSGSMAILAMAWADFMCVLFEVLLGKR